MKRRKFILLSLIGAVGTSLPACQPSPASRVRPGQLASICDEKTLREIGQAYLQQTASENDIDKLAGLIMHDTSGRKADDILEREHLDKILGQQVLHDFRDGNIVVVKGWVLCVTEARLCGLLTRSS